MKELDLIVYFLILICSLVYQINKTISLLFLSITKQSQKAFSLDPYNKSEKVQKRVLLQKATQIILNI